MKPTLLVLAAGMGSRYGGLKQLDPVGPSGETILDYSVYDAIQAGFDKVVFVIRHDFEEAFRERAKNSFDGHIRVEYAFQDLNDLPKIVNTYGDRLMIEVKADPKVVYDDETTDEQYIQHIRDIVDTYGAQANPGSGAVMSLGCGNAHGFYLMEEELYRYSSEQYAGLQ